ncbi:MAG: SGNH/GDSL hydrolase family protein [Gordonia sp. (in: high G+C Gram-positive bacteria)]|uniref:SGNH/GDSL hydrolase family protein n=1 Tax=Gordonia sp. (in: high G+C Gram-positive bacteria) TaxID=84139 RepID=UPI0039E5609D
MRKFALPALLLALLTLVGALVPAYADAAPQPYRGGTFVALGDSRAAGAFTDPRGLGDEIDPQCKRSKGAYPAVASRIVHARRFVNVACGGATSAEIWHNMQVVGRKFNPVQLSEAPRDATLVTVSTGHNDLDLGRIRYHCLSKRRDRKCRSNRSLVRRANYRVAFMRNQVAAALHAVRRQYPHAQIVVLGPGGLIPGGAKACRRSLPMSDADAAWLGGLYDRANTIEARLAGSIGATYVDVQRYAGAHGVCAGGSAWFAGEASRGGAIPYHMTRGGARAIGRLVADAVVR